LVERVTLTLRPALAPLGRKTYSFCKDHERLRQRVVFFQAFYHVSRPPMSLQQRLPLRAYTRHGALRPRWWERTPAMAAGLTDHVWTFRELLIEPPWPPRKPLPLGDHNQRVPDRRALDTTFLVLRSACQWGAPEATGRCSQSTATAAARSGARPAASWRGGRQGCGSTTGCGSAIGLG